VYTGGIPGGVHRVHTTRYTLGSPSLCSGWPSWLTFAPWAQDGQDSPSPPGLRMARNELTFAPWAQDGSFLLFSAENRPKTAVLARKRSKTARFGHKSAQNGLFFMYPPTVDT